MYAACGRKTNSNPITLAAIAAVKRREQERLSPPIEAPKDPPRFKVINRNPADISPKTPREIARSDIAMVALVYGVTYSDIMSKRRLRNIVLARQAACWMLKFSRGYSQPEIGRLLGIDHTTVLHGLGKHLRRMGVDDPAARRAEKRCEHMRIKHLEYSRAA